jgi:transcriptional regulator with XRE-family HTH domain
MSPRRFESEFTGAQLRAARGLLNLSAEALAEETKVSLRTIRRAEQDTGAVQINAANAVRIKSVLETHGIIFFTEGEVVGVKLQLEATTPVGPETTSQQKGLRK